MVLDGHQGESAAEFTVLSLAGKILSEPRIEDPKSLLERVFRETENSFFVGMDDPIGRRLALRAELSVRERGKRRGGESLINVLLINVCFLFIAKTSWWYI